MLAYVVVENFKEFLRLKKPDIGIIEGDRAMYIKGNVAAYIDGLDEKQKKILRANGYIEVLKMEVEP